MLTAGYGTAPDKEEYHGYTIVRVGGRWSVYWKAFLYYRNHLAGWPDVTIEEVNTIPFFTQWYVKGKRYLQIHQLCREIWFYQMFFPINVLGYILEPVYLWFLRKNQVMTVSQSSKDDLIRRGFSPNRIHICPQGLEIEPVKKDVLPTKYENITLLSLGAVRAMKRTVDHVLAFNLVKPDYPNLKLVIAGDGNNPYFQELQTAIDKSPYKKDIEYLGRVSREKKQELYQKTHAILVTSVKEGWGLIVSEANSQGTPAITYNVDGLRDSNKEGINGFVATQNTPAGLAEAIKRAMPDLEDPRRMRTISVRCIEAVHGLTFARTYQEYMSIIAH
jgi:glycosyltransferase involved in cell wall biosynthesis